MLELKGYLLFVKNTSSLEISASCFNQKTKSPLSPPLLEGRAFEPFGNNMDKVEEKPKGIIKFTAEKLTVDVLSQIVISPLCGIISLLVGTERNNLEGKKITKLRI
jgi:molybdopterin synthase catalytic subunit